MGITLTRQDGTQVRVTCDSQSSHLFDLCTLIPNDEKGPPHPLADPIAYGRAIYQALFPPETSARQAIASAPERIPPPSLADTDLHIIAVPSSPLDKDVPTLNIEGEWLRLQDIIEQVPYAIALERARPPSIEQVRALLANQRYHVVHFMGHGEQHEASGAFLCFEKENGSLDPVAAKQFVLRVRGTLFLVTLNACVSATPGLTPFSNLAASLVRQRVPYALGMRFRIYDGDARNFSRTFYNELARGSSVEEALLQARLTLAISPISWVTGVPVLNTSLAQPATGFAAHAGKPTIKDYPPNVELNALLRPEGAFQGRMKELVGLGTALTGDARPPLLTIHGGGGQGKTTLAREAAQRFSFAWPGGVWATTLETLPDKATFVTDLARFLGIDTQGIPSAEEVERLVLARLMQRRTLLVLDNAETLIEAVKANDTAALRLVECIRRLQGPSVSLLVTSRVQLQWSGEASYEVGGLSSEEGASLFVQSAPQRAHEVAPSLAQSLSNSLQGHPLGLLLLGKAFNASTISLRAFLEEYETHMARAENQYLDPEHRQRTLHACIEMSVRYLDADLRSLLSGLWIFHAPFLPATAVAVFDPAGVNTEEHPSAIRDGVYSLWQHGLLARDQLTVRDGTLDLYRLLPTTRPYVEHHLQQAYVRDDLLARFGAAYAHLAGWIYARLRRSAAAITLAQQAREDLERGIACVEDRLQGYYLLHWGWTLHRLGNPLGGLPLLERALEMAQGQDQFLEMQALNNLAIVYQDIGRPQEALQLYEQALPITREVGDRAGEAATLNGLAYLYKSLQRYTEAHRAFEQSILLAQHITYPAAEVAGMVGLASLLYQHLDQPQRAITTMEQAITVLRETGLPQDAAGQTAQDLQRLLQTMRTGTPLGGNSAGPSTMPAAHIQRIIANTIAVMTTVQERGAEWREDVAHLLQEAQQRGVDRQIEVDFFTAILDMLDGRSPSLSPDHPYAQAITAIQDGIATGGPQEAEASLDDRDEVMQAVLDFVNAKNWEATRQVMEAQQALLFRPEVERLFEANIAQARSSGDERIVRLLELHLSILRACKANDIAETFEQIVAVQEHGLPFDAELIPRSIAALAGSPQEKMEHMQYLATLTAQAADEGLKALINAIQLALFGSDLSQLGQDLQGLYQQAWDAIVAGVYTEGGIPS